MADGILLLEIHLGEGPLKAIRNEYRVIPESTSSSPGQQDPTLHGSLEGVLAATMHPCQHRTETSRAVHARTKVPQQFIHVRRSVLPIAGVSRTVDAGSTTERIDLKPAIVRKTGQPRVQVHEAGFLKCVVRERITCLKQLRAKTHVR